ncbi:MAG: neuraminidase-like domain-containing protein [Caldilineaceae bacterium]
MDAAFVAPAGGLYLFKGGQYVRYAQVDQEFVDEGYPKALEDNWGDLPNDFEEGIDGAFVFEGRTYLLKGEHYVRYADSSYAAIESIYPQKFSDRWGGWADYLLNDIRLIVRFKQLHEAHYSAEANLVHFLSNDEGAIKTPYATLNAIFGWDVDEAQWLKRHNGFLGAATLFEERFQLELIVQMVEIFTAADQMSAAPSDLYVNVWQNLFEQNNLGAAADALVRYMATRNGEKEWQVLRGQIHNELNLRKRDALMAYVIAHMPGVENARDLYEHFLVDVEMGGAGTASRVQEAIAAVQLYLHRYFVNLEQPPVAADQRAALKGELKTWWAWMKNYRVWEANRKVFLYPENYIRPELRDTKTPAFKTLEEDILQGEITDVLVQRAYKKYLDEYTEVSRLTIAGGYVYDAPDAVSDARNLVLVLFGRTKTDPRRYYYRLTHFLGGSNASVIWSPWLEVNVQIEADKVYPVYAFDRVFVFWSKVEAIPDTSSSATLTTTTNGNAQTVSSNATVTYKVKLYYSFYNLNKEWTQAQLLGQEILETKPVDQVKLFVENSDNLNIPGAQGLHENIIITCAYRAGGLDKYQAFSLTPELYAAPTAAHPFDNRGRAIFNTIFDEPQIAESNVVMFNSLEKSSDGPWFSFDHKGGSFLCRPAVDPLPHNAWPKFLKGNPDHLPQWDHIDAAFRTPDGQEFFFHNNLENQGGRFATSSNLAAAATALPATRKVWGRLRNNVAQSGVVDAALNMGGKVYLFSGNEYLTYSQGLELADADTPKALASNDENLPKWSQIDAAFTAANGRSYFFNNATQKFVVREANGQLSQERPVRDHWGQTRGGQGAPVSLFFTAGEHTYVIFGNRYARFDGNKYGAFAEGFPKPFESMDRIAGLRFTDETSIDTRKVEVAYYHNGALYFQYDDGNKAQRLAIDVNSPGSGGFLAHLDREIIAIAYHGGRIYVFKRNGAGDAAFASLCIYSAGARRWLQHSIKIVDANNRPVNLDTALVGKDGHFYLFSGNAYMKSAVWSELVESAQPANEEGAASDDDNAQPTAIIRWRPEAHTVNQDWLHATTTRIAETGLVDAAFSDGAHTWLFSGTEYVRYTGDAYDFIDNEYPQPIAQNSEGLPRWSQMGAAFRAENSTYFFDNSDHTFVTSAQFDQKVKTQERWGIIRNNFTERGVVDAAYVSGDKLYLTSGAQFIRYTLPLNLAAQPAMFVDAGYPKAYQVSGMTGIQAAFTQKDKVYLFSGNRYAKLTAPAEIDSGVGSDLIQGNWGNVPLELRSGMDAALNRGDVLFLFKGNQYIRYAAETAAYEIWDVPYAIVRLTTSTAYKLNQKLLAGGVPALLNVETQETDELPAFSESAQGPTTIKVKAGRIAQLPISSHLDFYSANGIYYWEVFFHAPYLIAQALNTGQKFEEAKRWYEYIFDPTEIGDYWRFLPFLTVDVQALIDSTLYYVQQLAEMEVDVRALATAFAAVFERLAPHAAAFQQTQELSQDDEDALKAALTQVKDALPPIRTALAALTGPVESARQRRFQQARFSLQERVEIMANLWDRYQLLGNRKAQMRTYLADPFDPHAVAALRTVAYRKAIVMAYIDNLLDWGDMLFRQYTRESINEARMLYILAYDLLGDKPENLGVKQLVDTQPYAELANDPDEYELVIYTAHAQPTGAQPIVVVEDAPLTSIGHPYFFVPENELFTEYWNRVEDRLYKIRQSLNILGISQPLPLFEPPIDPMALVQAVSSGASISSALASLNVPIPHYRFSFMVRKAQELVQKLNGLGGDLLAALEKKDAEELSLLQNRQEAVILGMTRAIKDAQWKEAQTATAALVESLNAARNQSAHYQRLLAQGLLPTEAVQMSLMLAGAIAQYVSVGLKIASGIMYIIPDVTVGLFSFGAKTGGIHAGDALSGAAEASETLGEALSMTGEVLGILAQHERMVQDWTLQKAMADSEIIQLTAQIEGARLREAIAQREIEILEKEIEHNAAIKRFMQEKFTNAQLYQWMIGKLSGIYYQTYQMAYDMAKAAEKSFQYEQGEPQSAANFIQPLYWDSQRKGLLAGESLSLDLDRMEKAFIENDARGLEIAKKISLLELDPVAFLSLKSRGVAEFSLSEALFDYDFPGHYRRQIKTVALTFLGADGELRNVNATLTQLSHKTVLEPDAKAVKYLLNPKDLPPAAIRSDWKSSQQIVLSHIDEYEKNHGLFELRFDDERYLPFEGTGAVSSWRLELNGKPGAYNVEDIVDIVMTVKYSAEQGGQGFANAVKGMLKPYATARFIDVASEFPDAWDEFITGDSNELVLPISRDLFPNMSSSKISGLFARYVLAEPGAVSMTLNGSRELTLADGKALLTSSLSISSQGSEWTFALNGDKANLVNMGLVLGYKARV